MGSSHLRQMDTPFSKIQPRKNQPVKKRLKTKTCLSMTPRYPINVDTANSGATTTLLSIPVGITNGEC